ncbi:hypothetical protein CYY_005495 [Polysphondylium violaceum]|uniref:MACPF domain-containing protein n=1 Tax=Polysphondylium violaceum TaxID=133409 RepID=A0A8J4PST4_9MYCE|nr:hypothetical protein CYY_005495 [Polysphondylium violaceum]
MESKSSEDFKANVGGSFRGYSANAAASFSQEKSVEEAKKHSVDTKKKLFKTDLYCTTSFVELDLDRVSLHPNFLESLSQVKTAGDMLELIEIYGTHHYKNSYLGGKLSQITSTLESNVESQGSSSWEETSSASLAASVSSPSFSVSAEVSGTLDKSNSEEEQKSNMEKSSTSRLITYGGAPAAFSPASDGTSSPLYSEWTSTIDLSPVPFNYQLYPIRNLIKDTWTILDNDWNHVKLKDLWEEAETLFYSKNNKDDNSAKYSLIFTLNKYDAKLIVDEPVLEITYYSRENNQIVSHDFKVFVHGTHINRRGMRETAAFSNLALFPLLGSCQEYKAFHLDKPPTYKTAFVHCDGGVKDMVTFPIRFDFSGPNFFSSYNKPDITLKLRSGAPLTLKTGSYGKIISWYTNEAILFDQTGVLNSKTEYFATAFLENRWSWHLHNAQNHHYQLNPNGILGECLDCHLPCGDNPNAECPCPQCTDSVIFGFRGAPIPFKPDVGDNRPYPPTVPQQYIHTSAMKKRVVGGVMGSTLDWFDFSGKVESQLGDTMMVENEANVGMLTRVIWIKVFWPNHNIPWKRTLKTWHIDDHQVENLHVSEFLHYEFDQDDPSSLQSKWGFYPLSVNKYDRDLFVYHNYRYPEEGVNAYNIIHTNVLPSYQDVLNNKVKIYY